MRGIPWVYVPTTLVSMVDVCVGGKNALNFGSYKNTLGTFYPAHRVIIDTNFIKTLPREAIVSGLIEAAKTCFCRGPETFEKYLSLYDQYKQTSSIPEELIQLSLNSKQHFVEIDEFDHNQRRHLNFGHTFGHAIESTTDFSVPHGIAVGVGILAALEMALEVNGLPINEKLQHHLLELLSAYLLDVKVPHDPFIEALLRDKKSVNNTWTFILPQAQGGTEVYSLADAPEARALIWRSLQKGLFNLSP